MKLPECPPADINAARELLSAVSESIPAVQSLRGRWSAINGTLARLRDAADDLADLPSGTTSHPLVAEILRSLSGTLTLTLDLCHRCAAGDDPPEGKLRAQSDLAAASASLECLATDAELLIRTGALVEPPPFAGSGRGAARAEARALVTRLQLGSASASARSAALDSLLALLEEDDKNVLIVAAQGVAPALAMLIGSSSQEKALAALARLTSVEGCRHVLISEGPILLARLARVLDSSAGPAAEHACAALQPLTLIRDHAVVFGSQGSVASLLSLCRRGTPAAQAAAAGVLRNLSLFQELHQNLLEESTIPTLITLLSSGTVQAQGNALSCLRNLTSGEGLSVKLAILQEGILDCLKNYWESRGVEDGKNWNWNLEPALGLLRNLVSLKYIAETVITVGFVPLVAAALADDSSRIRIEAANVVSELAVVLKATKEFGKAGAVHHLVMMLEAKMAAERESAVKVLASLMQCHEYRRLFRKEERGVVNVVQLLDPMVKNVEKKYAVSVLAAIVQSRQCRKQMVVAGACGYLRKLVDVQVEGAKRLLEILMRGNLWGVFARS